MWPYMVQYLHFRILEFPWLHDSWSWWMNFISSWGAASCVCIFSAFRRNGWVCQKASASSDMAMAAFGKHLQPKWGGFFGCFAPPKKRDLNLTQQNKGFTWIYMDLLQINEQKNTWSILVKLMRGRRLCWSTFRNNRDALPTQFSVRSSGAHNRNDELPFHLPSGKLTVCYGKSPFVIGKCTISMAIFSSYVKLPEGNYGQ